MPAFLIRTSIHVTKYGKFILIIIKFSYFYFYINKISLYIIKPLELLIIYYFLVLFYYL
jgi:hypothetical protein